MDYMAIVSNGVYPTPTPTDKIRSALAVSFGLLDVSLSEADVSTLKSILLSIGKVGINFARKMLRIG